jgi:putative nucleotidyltransferase with HDIG domain
MVKSFKTLFGSRRKRRWLGTMSGGREERAGRPWRLDKQKIVLLLLTVAALSAMMAVRLRSERVSLHAGSISPREVRAGRSAFYVDSVKTEQLRHAARESVAPVYDLDEDAVVKAQRMVAQLFNQMREERAPSPTHQPLKPKQLRRAIADSQLASLLPRPTLTHLLTVPPAVFQKLNDTTTRLVKEAMEREIRNSPDDLPHARQDLYVQINSALPDTKDAAVARMVAEQALRPTRLLNQRKTEAAQEAAAHAVAPVVERLLLGEKIVGAGETVTPEVVDKLRGLGLIDPRTELTTTAAICLLAVVMVFLVVYYIKRSLPALYNDNRKLTLLAVIVLLSVIGLKIGAILFGLSVPGGQLGYVGMMSVAAAGMLVSVMLDTPLALLIVALLSVQSGILMNHEIRFTVLTLMSSLMGIVCVPGSRRTHNLHVTAAWLALGNVGMVCLLGLLFSDTRAELLLASAWAVGTAGLTVFLYWFGQLVLEKPFGILTHTALLELSAFDRPLLQQLCAVAPGTYAHSVMVGTLSEAAAQAIGADALLCRVAGYYHDIGKMNRPDFFVENQRQENVHGRLSPSLSALIIIAHVRDGIELAKEHRLPIEIRDIIAQHHGTTLISYFYHQALTDNGGSEGAPAGLEARFRYPGPKPQTSEAAVVMLADSVEAAARCLDRPDQESLQALIQNIVRGKIEDGQLDACPLTFHDVKLISDAFLHVLKAMNHGRIKYPKEPPRTGSGQPMEVVRADLRPEPVSQPVAANLLRGMPEMAVDGIALPMAGLETEASREIAAHLGAPQALTGRGTLSFVDEHEALDSEAENHSTPTEISGIAMAHPLPFVRAEVVYGRYSAEQPIHTGPDETTPPGDPPTAADVGPGTR